MCSDKVLNNGTEDSTTKQLIEKDESQGKIVTVRSFKGCRSPGRPNGEKQHAPFVEKQQGTF